jgi:HSP20 family protein
MPAMRTRIPSVALPSEAGEFADEIGRLFADLGRSFGGEGLTGECSPPLDVFETDEAVEVRVDLPGVDATAVRVLAKGPSLLIAGQKSPRRGRGDLTFHLVERGFGRFIRTVRLAPPCDAARAEARLVNGELRIRLPKVVERRGQVLQVPVAGAGPEQ